jgi:hypothetical protein
MRHTRDTRPRSTTEIRVGFPLVVVVGGGGTVPSSGHSPTVVIGRCNERVCLQSSLPIALPTSRPCQRQVHDAESIPAWRRPWCCMLLCRIVHGDGHSYCGGEPRGLTHSSCELSHSNPLPARYAFLRSAIQGVFSFAVEAAQPLTTSDGLTVQQPSPLRWRPAPRRPWSRPRGPSRGRTSAPDNFCPRDGRAGPRFDGRAAARRFSH